MNLILEPGFEESPTTWVLGTNCPIGTAEIQGTVVHSGAKALGITRVTIGGVQRCGYAERLVTGLKPGRVYRISIWHRTAGTSGGVTATLQIDGISQIVMATLSLTWAQLTSLTFTVSGTSAMLRINVAGSAATQGNTRYFDDLFWESGDVPDEADPSSLSGRAGVSGPESTSGIVAPSGKISATAAPLSVVGNVSSLAMRGRPSKP